MKKYISVILAFVMLLSLCACGKAISSEPSIDENVDTELEMVQTTSDEPQSDATSADGFWVLSKSTDEFGDVTDNSIIALSTVIQGEFSNTATISSELFGKVIITPSRKGSSHYAIIFELYEYGDSPITYTTQNAESLVLKTKIGDVIEEYKLIGAAPNGSLIMYPDEESGINGDSFYINLVNGNDIRCIITIGSSEYSFTVESGNIAEANNSTYAAASDINKTIVENLVQSTDAAMLFSDDYISSRCNIESVSYTANAYFIKMLGENGSNGFLAQDKIALVYQLEGTFKNESDAEKVGSNNFKYYGLVCYNGINPEVSAVGTEPEVFIMWSPENGTGWLTDSELIDEAVIQQFTTNAADGFNNQFGTNVQYIVSKFE